MLNGVPLTTTSTNCIYRVTSTASHVTPVRHLRHTEFMQIPGFDDDQLLGESMLEEIRRTAERRLHQIEPLLEEAQRLRDVLEVLERRTDAASEVKRPGVGHAQSARSRHNASGRTQAAGQRSRTRTPSDSGARAAKGSNKRTIMQLVAQKPGITAAQIAQLTGMKRTVVASTVSRLKRYGELLDHESGGVCVPPAATSAHTAPAVPVSAVPRQTPRRSRPRRLAATLERRAA